MVWQMVEIPRRLPLATGQACFAPDFAIEIGVSIRQHPTGSPTVLGGSDHVRTRPWTDRAGRRAKRFLSPSQKYEIWLQLVRQEVTIAEAASEHHVDRSTITRIRTVAKEGALAALAASKPWGSRGSGITSWSWPGPRSSGCPRR
jgi:hypothetical protein